MGLGPPPSLSKPEKAQLSQQKSNIAAAGLDASVEAMKLPLGRKEEARRRYEQEERAATSTTLERTTAANIQSQIQVQEVADARDAKWREEQRKVAARRDAQRRKQQGIPGTPERPLGSGSGGSFTL